MSASENYLDVASITLRFATHCEPFLGSRASTRCRLTRAIGGDAFLLGGVTVTLLFLAARVLLSQPSARLERRGGSPQHGGQLQRLSACLVLHPFSCRFRALYALWVHRLLGVLLPMISTRIRERVRFDGLAGFCPEC